MLVSRATVNISFLAEKIPYSQMCGTKVGMSYQNGVKVKFNTEGHTDGFHGRFEVRDENGNQRLFECTGCENTSTSLNLGSLYLDSDQDGNIDRPNNANCRDNCNFVIKGEVLVYKVCVVTYDNLGWTLKWKELSNPGALGFTIYDEKDNPIYKRAVAYVCNDASDVITVPGIISKIKFNSNTDGFHGHFEVRDPSGNLRKMECIGCKESSSSL